MEPVCEPRDWRWAERILPLARQALERLGWAEIPGRLVLAVDALAPDERIWLQLAPREVVLHVHEGHFGHLPGGDTPLPWEMPPVAEAVEASWDPATAAVFLHRQLLAARDLRDGVLRPAEVPARLAPAVQEAWAVTIDGRLARHDWPSWSLAERRRLFARRFAVGGELLPRHWETFRRLWDWDEPDHEGLVRAASGLPTPG